MQDPRRLTVTRGASAKLSILRSVYGPRGEENGVRQRPSVGGKRGKEGRGVEFTGFTRHFRSSYFSHVVHDYFLQGSLVTCSGKSQLRYCVVNPDVGSDHVIANCRRFISQAAVRFLLFSTSPGGKQGSVSTVFHLACLAYTVDSGFGPPR